MSRKSDITKLIQNVADKGTDDERMALGTPGSTVHIDGQSFGTGQLWTADTSFVDMMVEGLANYFDDFMEEVEQKIEEAF